MVGAGLGGAFGFGSGLVGSAISQKRNTGKINWRKAVSSGIDGAIIGATQGGLIASGAGIPTAFTANFFAGAAGSAAEQYFNHRKIDVGKSITRGLTNAVTGAAITPHGLMSDPKRGCGSESPFMPKLSYHSARGCRYDVPGTGESRNQDQFSMLGFVRETILGGLMGGLGSAAFYGAGKGIEKLKESVRGRNVNRGSRFPENPNDMFPENYVGLEKEIKPDGKINYIVQAGDKTYKVEYHPKHTGDGHYDGNHYHVLKLGEIPKPGKTKPPYFRLPNLDPNKSAQGGTFAPGDLLPTKNKK